MKLKIKLFPAVMTVLSALYLIYVRSSEDTTIVADAVGGDPGGKLLPTILAIFMFVGFLYITIKERPDGKREEKGTVLLFLLTLGLSIAYVLLLRSVGFIIMSVVLLYILVYVYTTIDEKRSIRDAVLGGAGTVVVTSGVYYLMRFVTKSLMRLAREGALPAIFGATVFEGFISVVLIVGTTLILAFTICKALKKKNRDKLADACLVTFATVLILYIVFKQFFNVNLAPGLLNY